MKKVYIPFNMIVDTDYGVIRLVEKTQHVSEYSINKLKSFLIKRQNENPINEYNKLRGLDVIESAYDMVLDKYYENVLSLSMITDIFLFVVNTHKLGASNELKITIGCNCDCEIEYLKKIFSSLENAIIIELDNEINLNDFDFIFTKVLDVNKVDYLIDDLHLTSKRLYVADYNFNKVYDNNNRFSIDAELHLRLEEEGIIVSLISIYNKK